MGANLDLEVMFCGVEWAGMILMRRSWRRKHRRHCGVNSCPLSPAQHMLRDGPVLSVPEGNPKPIGCV